MNCGNCGKKNAYKAKVCAHCGSTLSLTEYFRPTGFVEKQKLYEEAPKESEQPKKAPVPASAPVQKQQGKQGKKQPARSKQQTPPKEKHSPAPKPEPKKAPKAPAKQPKEDSRQPKEQKSGKGKKAPIPKAYNHTADRFSMAEKAVHKKSQKPNRKWIFPLVLIITLCVIAGFIGRVHFYRAEDRYTKVAEQFVQAVVMSDSQVAAQCVHPKMRGTLRPLGYENVDGCEVVTLEHEELKTEQIAAELLERFAIEDTVSRAFRVSVKYTVYGAQDVACTMDVLVANIGGEIYAIKTENIDDSQMTPS